VKNVRKPQANGGIFDSHCSLSMFVPCRLKGLGCTVGSDCEEFHDDGPIFDNFEIFLSSSEVFPNTDFCFCEFLLLVYKGFIKLFFYMELNYINWIVFCSKVHVINLFCFGYQNKSWESSHVVNENWRWLSGNFAAFHIRVHLKQQISLDDCWLSVLTAWSWTEADLWVLSEFFKFY